VQCRIVAGVRHRTMAGNAGMEKEGEAGLTRGSRRKGELTHGYRGVGV
jgi:hypothetical protein